jgi:photosystem II stability/assembly factor-like uncharacterized protein
VAVGLDGEIWRTADGGVSWSPVKSPATRALYTVAMEDGVGWIVGDTGTVMVSKDTGATWQVVPVPEDLRLFWIHGVSLIPDGTRPTGVLVGANGLMLWTQNDRIRRQ